MASPLHRVCLEWLLPALLLVASCRAENFRSETEAEKSAKAKQALDYVERVRNTPCTGGTEEILPVEFDHTMWNPYADVAVRMSNLLTKLLIQGNNSLGIVDDTFFFNLVRNNVDSESVIFGSGICLDAYVYPKYRMFCPYAYKKDAVYSHDISLNYNYLDVNTEYFHVLKEQDWEYFHVLKEQDWSPDLVSTNWVIYRYNLTFHDAQQAVMQPMARVEHGHWTRPYFDCGGGDIWMVTYSAPIFGLDQNTSKPIFSGIGTIDIKLTDIDINQCDYDSNPQEAQGQGQNIGAQQAQSVDVFRGTHNCRQTTKCVPIRGLGFTRGAYKCKCRDGFYFPEVKLPQNAKAFNGSELEEIFSIPNVSYSTSELSRFECLPCAEGCETCEDNSPCLYSNKLAVRIPLLALTLILMGFVLVISILVGLFKSKRAIKSSSPMFLHVMTCGSGLMCLPVIISFIEPTELTCILKIWPQHIGFSLAYGALLLKTWRISAIFQVKSARQLNLSDKVLVQRFIPIMGVTCGYLIAWTAIGHPELVWRRTNQGLKFVDCTSDYWELGIFLGEACFLLWGAYLCYVVRKAPSHFNESKFITWSIYNNIILGTFIIVIKQFIAMSQGPDVIYLVDFMYMQVTVTITMCLIFIPKVYGLNQVSTGPGTSDDTTVTGRVKTKIQPSGDNPAPTKDITTQTDITADDITLMWAAQPNTSISTSRNSNLPAIKSGKVFP